MHMKLDLKGIQIRRPKVGILSNQLICRGQIQMQKGPHFEDWQAEQAERHEANDSAWVKLSKLSRFSVEFSVEAQD